MQPISNPGNVSLQGEKTLETALSKTATSQTDDLPLTLAQRTSLEKLVMQISTLSGAKPAEVWATVRAELGTKNNAELLASQFPAAEQSLQNRLTTIQGSQDSRQLLQQLTSLLSQGNNRQAVSDFIRQQFGHTVLSSLTPSQLKLVVTLLQNGQLPQAATLLSIGAIPRGCRSAIPRQGSRSSFHRRLPPPRYRHRCRKRLSNWRRCYKPASFLTGLPPIHHRRQPRCWTAHCCLRSTTSSTSWCRNW
ncbi:Flagellar regulator flk [Dickeya solani]|nr:Flagellar regulator flk [Dickeya solani]